MADRTGIKRTAADLRAALRLVHPAAEYALMFEVNEGTGMNLGRRADALLVSLWPSRGLEITVFEIKTSRSDWLSELKAPEKMEAIGVYADRIVLFTAPGVARRDEIPERWGHWELRDSDRIVRVKQAPKLDPEPVPRETVAAWMRARGKLDSDDLAALHRKWYAEWSAEQKKRLGNIDPASLADVQRREESLAAAEAKLHAVREATGISLLGWTPAETLITRLNLITNPSYQHQLRALQTLLCDDKLRETVATALGAELQA